MSDFKKPGPLVLEGNLKENYAKFKKLYDIYASASKTDKEAESVQVARFLSCAGEEAIELFETFDITNENKQKIKEVQRAFETYCNPHTNEVYERYLFYKRCQKEGEPFDHFMADIMKLAESCNFGDMKDAMLRDRIVIGILDTNVQSKLLKTEGLTLSKAKEYCRVAEITNMQAKEISNKEFKNVVDDVSKKHGSIKKKNNCSSTSKNLSKSYNFRSTGQSKAGCNESADNSSRCKFCNRFHKYGKCPAYGKKCITCNKKNHFSIVCYKNKNKVSDISCSKDEDEVNKLYIDSMCYAVNESDHEKNFWYEKLLINNEEIEFKLDSGAEVNIIPLYIYEKIKAQCKLAKTKVRLEAYGGHKIESVGSTILNIAYKDKNIKASFVIVKVKAKPILGLSTCVKLGLIKRVSEIINQTKEEFILKNNDVFKGEGKYPETCSLKLKEGTVPVHNPPRRVPLSIKGKLKNTLDNMVKRGIISKVLEPTGWAHNLVIVEKPDGSLRLCLDPKQLNINLVYEHFLIPRLEDFRYVMRNKKIYTVLDLKEGFWQLGLDEESKKLTAFSSPFGTYQFNVLPFGVSTAPEKFQKINEKYFGNLPGCFVYIDDLIVGGETIDEHDKNLEIVLKRAREINVKFNPKKLQYRVTQVKYLGHIFSGEGISPDPERIKAINKIKEPENRKELERLLGTLNYLRAFIPNYAELNSQLRMLLKKNVIFQWTATHTEILNKIKEVLSKQVVLHSFSPDKQIVIQTDASSNGLGCCLFQENKPISFASKSLTPTEINYAQIEKELLAIVYACTKFHEYIYGHHIIVHTDHKPLLGIMNKPISQIHSNRLQRMRIKLLKYKIEMKYIPGKDLHVPDFLSRTSAVDQNIDTEDILKDVVHSIDMSDNKKKLFQKETENDEILSNLIRLCKQGWPKDKTKLPENLKSFWNIKDKLIYEDKLIFYEDRVFVPKTLISQILKILHEAHLGIVKTISRAKTLLYWPFMNRDIENMIRKCKICEKYMACNNKHPLVSHELPSLPFEKVGVDIFELGKEYYIVVVDYFSKWIEIQKIKSKKSHDVIMALKKIFSTHGIPRIVVADNQPFSSYEFKDFSNEWNFTFKHSSPRYPRSNGLAEKGVHIAKMLLKKSREENKDFYSSILEQRSTIIPRLGLAPCEMLMNRQLRTKLPIRNEKLIPKVPLGVQDKLKYVQSKQKEQHDRSSKRKELELKPGDNIVYQSGRTWKPAQVVEKYKNAPRSYIIRDEDNKHLRRNTYHIRNSLNIPQFNQYTDQETEIGQENLRNSSKESEAIDRTLTNDLNKTEKSTETNSSSNLLDIDTKSSTSYRTRYGRESKKPSLYQAYIGK